MPQLVPAALVAPTRPGLVAALNIGYRVRSMAGTYGTFVVAADSNSPIVEVGTGYYLVTAGVSIPDAGGVIEWWTNSSGSPGTFLSAVAADPVPSNFTDLAITASTGQVTVGANNDKTGYSLSSTQNFSLTGNITGNLSGSVGSVTGNVGGSVGSVTNAVTVGSLANNSITAAVIATDAIDADAIAASAVTEIQAGLATQSSVNAIPTTPAPTAAQNATQVRTELNTELSRIDATISSRLASSGYTTPPTTGQIRIELATELARIDVATSTRLATAGYTAPPTAAQNATQVRTELGTELARIDTSISSRSTLSAAQIRTELATELARLDVAVSTRLATAGYTTPPTTAQIATAVEAALLNDADGQALLAAIQTAVQALFDQQADIPVATLVSLIAAQITTDHGAGSYVAPNISALALEASVQLVKAKTDNLPSDPADQSLLIDAINTRASQASVDTKASQSSVDTVQAGVSAIPVTPLLAANYTAPDNAGIAAIKAKTDNLPSDPADQSLIEAAISALPSAAIIADTVWAEPLAGYTTEGTAGKKLSDTATPTNIPPGLTAQQVWEYATRQLTGTQASNLAAIPNIPTNPLLSSAYTPPPSAATIADAVWDETLSQHLTAGSTGAKLNLASTLTVGDIPAGLSAQQVWEYATRTLSVASGLTNAQELKLNELHRKAGLDPAVPVTRTLNPATGNVAETFTGVAINHVETGTTVVTTRQP